MTATARPVPALTSFVALVERPFHGGADRVLRVEPATKRTELLREALALNCPGLTEGYLVLDGTYWVIRQGGTQKYGRWMDALALYADQGHAQMVRDWLELGSGKELVVEQLTPEIAKMYDSWRVMG